MNGSILRLIEKIIKDLVWVYRKYEIDYFEECGAEDSNMTEIECNTQSLQAYGLI